MGYVLGKKSLEQLATVELPLQNVIKRAIELTQQDFTVLEGRRTLARQYELFSQGRTTAEIRKAGVPVGYVGKPKMQKVTWTLNSNHFPRMGRTLGRAVDIYSFPIDMKAGVAVYRVINEAVMAAAKEQGVKIRWGGDWDGDGRTERGESDFVHFELV